MPCMALPWVGHMYRSTLALYYLLCQQASPFFWWGRGFHSQGNLFPEVIIPEVGMATVVVPPVSMGTGLDDMLGGPGTREDLCLVAWLGHGRVRSRVTSLEPGSFSVRL